MEAETATSQCGSRPRLGSASQRVVQEAWLVMPHDLCKVMLSSLQARLGNGVIVLALPTLQGKRDPNRTMDWIFESWVNSIV